MFQINEELSAMYHIINRDSITIPFFIDKKNTKHFELQNKFYDILQLISDLFTDYFKSKNSIYNIYLDIETLFLEIQDYNVPKMYFNYILYYNMLLDKYIKEAEDKEIYEIVSNLKILSNYNKI